MTAVPRLRSRPGPLLAVAALVLASGCSRGADRAEPSTAPATTDPAPSASSARPVDDRGPADPVAHATLGPWDGCRGAFQCTTLTVPRDWSDPAGATIDLAVMRRVATGDRIGSLVVNPGGPGVSGVDFLEGFRSLPDGLDERFDVVAWDPRGTGGSERIDCTTDEELLEPDLDPTPDDEAEVRAIRDQAQEDQDECTDAAGDLLPFVGTRATTRDLDALRGALGDDRLTYVGYSYGTAIGLDYLRLYPERVRAMVLDAVVLPGLDPVDDARAQARGFERTLDAYLAGCADRPACPLGDDPKATLLDLAARLEAERIPASYTLGGSGTGDREGTLGVGELYVAVAASLYSEAGWADLDDGLADALADAPRGEGLLYLRDSYLGRGSDGSWDDDLDARVAIVCADQAARADQPEGDLDRAGRWDEDLPFWGRWFATGLPGCWGLPPALEPLEPLGEDAVTGAPPIVLVGSTDDPATPYEQAEQARRAVEGARLVTFEGAEHTAYRSLTDCIDDPVTAYLVDLVPPEDGLRCPG